MELVCSALPPSHSQKISALEASSTAIAFHHGTLAKVVVAKRGFEAQSLPTVPYEDKFGCKLQDIGLQLSVP